MMQDKIPQLPPSVAAQIEREAEDYARKCKSFFPKDVHISSDEPFLRIGYEEGAKAQAEKGIKQDKNFTVRLKATIERKLKQAGVIQFGLFPVEEWDSKEKKQLWNFIESLNDVTLEDLQGEPH